MWGAEDLSASLGATENGDASGLPLALPARPRPVPDGRGRGRGVAAIDTVWTRIEDLDGLRAEARAARRDGFSAKAVIHPKHVEAVNAAFTPGAAEIAWAERIVAAFAADGAPACCASTAR